MVDFYCKVCKSDFREHEHKEGNSWGQWFASKCPSCGKKCIRHITEKDKDPYFYESKKLRIQRHNLKNELIQPGEQGFMTRYPKQWKQIEEANEKWEKKQKMKKLEREKLYQKHHNERSTLKKIFEKEDELENNS